MRRLAGSYDWLKKATIKHVDRLIPDCLECLLQGYLAQAQEGHKRPSRRNSARPARCQDRPPADPSRERRDEAHDPALKERLLGLHLPKTELDQDMSGVAM
jgi:hypothetical protein